MSEQREFDPRWPDEPNAPFNTYYPENMEQRTAHPEIVPNEVVDIISRTEWRYSRAKSEKAMFTLFPKLPIEIRRMIWQESLPGPRLVFVYCPSFTKSFFCISPCPIPTALYVTREARSTALEKYKARFAISSAGARPAQIYFNSEIDTLCLGIGNFSLPSIEDRAALFLRLLDPKDLESIKHLAIDSDLDTIYSDPEKGNPGLATLGLRCLESVVVVKKREVDVDFVLQRSADGSREFQVWQISNEGIPFPWHLTKEAGCWDGCLSGYLGDVEEDASQESPSIKTIRLVSWSILRRKHMWTSRIKFLERMVFVEEIGCLYEDDGVVSRLMDLLENDTLKYDELTDIINVGEVSQERLDPMDIYLWQRRCSCRIGHRVYIKAPEWFSNPWKVDLEAALKILDGR